MKRKQALYEMMGGAIRRADRPMVEVKFDPATITGAKRMLVRSMDAMDKPKSPFEVFEAMENVVHQLARIAKAAGDADLSRDFDSLSGDVSRTAKAFKEAVDPEAPDE